MEDLQRTKTTKKRKKQKKVPAGGFFFYPPLNKCVPFFAQALFPKKDHTCPSDHLPAAFARIKGVPEKKTLGFFFWTPNEFPVFPQFVRCPEKKPSVDHSSRP